MPKPQKLLYLLNGLKNNHKNENVVITHCVIEDGVQG